MRRRALLLLGALVPTAARAQPHWLVGRWEGEVSGGGGERGPQRVLLVESVGADGVGRGRLSFEGRGGDSTDIRISGETVTVTSGRGNTYTLRRVAPNRLEGDYFANSGRGRRYTVWLDRR
jgi:hypothetical protein